MDDQTLLTVDAFMDIAERTEARIELINDAVGEPAHGKPWTYDFWVRSGTACRVVGENRRPSEFANNIIYGVIVEMSPSEVHGLVVGNIPAWGG